MWTWAGGMLDGPTPLALSIIDVCIYIYIYICIMIIIMIISSSSSSSRAPRAAQASTPWRTIWSAAGPSTTRSQRAERDRLPEISVTWVKMGGGSLQEPASPWNAARLYCVGSYWIMSHRTGWQCSPLRHTSGGTTCLTQIVECMCSSTVAQNVANHDDPWRYKSRIKQTRPH